MMDKNVKVFMTVLVMIMLFSSLAVANFQHTVKAQNYPLNVNISSSATKISVGENVTLTAFGLNGSASYSFQWYAKVWQNENDSQPFTLFSSSNPAVYTLNASCAYVNFGVQVTDSEGNFGENYSITVYDPVVLNTMYSEGGVFPGAPDYTIWEEVHSGTTTYYAKNNYGDISISPSTNASYVVNSAIGTGNKYILFSSGVFTFTAPIELANNLRIAGENPQTTSLEVTPGANFNLMEYTSTTTKIYFLHIENLYLGGAGGTSGNGIALSSQVMDTKLNDLFISSFAGDGVLANNSWNLQMNNVIAEYNGGNGVTVKTGYDCNIYNSKFFNNTGLGVYIAASQSTLYNDFIEVNHKYGLEIQDPASDFQIIGCSFVGNGYDNAGLYDQIIFGAATVNRIKIIGNSFIGSYDGTVYSNKQITLINCTDCEVSDNSFVNNSATGTSGIIYDGGNGTSIHSNIGYNPVGYNANPFTGSTLKLLDYGDNATMTSGWTYTNQGSPKTFYVSGGTVTDIAVNGESIGLTSGTIQLQPGDNFSITFSSTPNLKEMVG